MFRLRVYPEERFFFFGILFLVCFCCCYISFFCIFLVISNKCCFPRNVATFFLQSQQWIGLGSILFLPWHWNVQRFHMPCHAYGLFIFKSAEFLCLCIFLCFRCIWQILLSLLSPWFSFAIWKSLSLWNSWLQESALSVKASDRKLELWR